MEKCKIPENNPQYEALRLTLRVLKRDKGPLIEALHRAQEVFGYLPKEVLCFISKELNIPLSKIYGVVTFYHFFRTEPVAKYLINVCLGTACYVKGAEKVLKSLSKELGIDVGGTTSDKLFTLSTARCFGCCGLAPVIMINEDVYGNLNEERVKEIIKEYREKEKEKVAHG